MARSDNITEQQEEQFWDDLAKKIREPNEKLLAEFQKEGKQRQLSYRQAKKADKLLTKEVRRERRDQGKIKKPGSFAGRIAKRTAGAGAGLVGDLIGGIPVAGAIFKALKEEASATLDARKEYKEELKEKRREELELLEELAAKRAELIKREQEKLQEKVEDFDESVAPATEQMTEAAERLSSATVDLTPVIENLSSTIEKVFENLPQLQQPAQSVISGDVVKITDPSTIEYLHAIEYFSQEGVAQAERYYASSEMHHELLRKDVGNIKWHTSRANGAVGRIEALMKENQIRDGEIAESIKNQEVMQKKSLEVQEDTRFAQILSVITNMISGGGLMKAMGGLAGGLGSLGKIAGKGLAVGAAWEIGQAIGTALNDWLSTKSWFNTAMEKMFQAMDAVLAVFGNDEAKRRLDVEGQMEDIAHANDLMQKAFGRQVTAFEEQFVRENGTLPGMSRDQFKNDSWMPFNKITEQQQIELVKNGVFDRSSHVMTPDEVIQYSNQKKEEAGMTTTPSINQSNVSNTNNNSQTVMPQPLNADPIRPVARPNR